MLSQFPPFAHHTPGHPLLHYHTTNQLLSPLNKPPTTNTINNTQVSSQTPNQNMYADASGQAMDQEKYIDVEHGPSQPKSSRLHALIRHPTIFIPLIIAAALLIGGILGLALMPTRYILAGATGPQIHSAFDAVPTVQATLPYLDVPAHDTTTVARRHEQRVHNSTAPGVDIMPLLNMTMPTSLPANFSSPFNHTKTRPAVDDVEIEATNGSGVDSGKGGLITGVIFGVVGFLVVLFLICSCRARRG